MTCDPQRYHRRSIRLRGYDYTKTGLYFVTICTQNRTCVWGDIVNGTIRLNHEGHIVQAIWDGLPAHDPGVDLDAFVVMPNHIHGILVIHAWAGWNIARTSALSEVVRGSRRLRRDASMPSEGRPVSRSGNAITTNTSSGIMNR